MATAALIAAADPAFTLRRMLAFQAICCQVGMRLPTDEMWRQLPTTGSGIVLLAIAPATPESEAVRVLEQEQTLFRASLRLGHPEVTLA